jgi:hypothetical protein
MIRVLDPRVSETVHGSFRDTIVLGKGVCAQWVTLFYPLIPYSMPYLIFPPETCRHDMHVGPTCH